MPHYDEGRGLIAGLSAGLSSAIAALINGGTLPAWFTNAKVTTVLGVGNTTPSASGAGISFPAAQSASTDVNTLDDYEEGSWTPAVNFGTTNSGTTYSSQVGRYTKIGNRVFFSALVALSSKGTSTGSMSVTGLPFPVSASSSNLVPVAARFQSLAAGIAHYSASMPVSASQVYLEKFAAGATNFLTDTDITNTSSFTLSGHYET